MRKNFLLVLMVIFAVNIFLQDIIAEVHSSDKKSSPAVNKTIQTSSGSKQKLIALLNSRRKNQAKTSAVTEKFTTEKLNSILKEKISIAKKAPLTKKDVNPYHEAKGLDNDGWYWDSNYDVSYDIDFNLTQSTPIVYSDLNMVSDPVFGGTTSNFGFGIISTDYDFGSYFMNIGITDFLNPLDYLVLDIAFDHTTNTMYCLYLNDQNPPCRGCLAEKGLPNPDPGYFLVGYKYSIINLLSNQPPEQITPLLQLYSAADNDLTQWAHLYMGLASDRSGQLYTVDYKSKKLCTVNKSTGLVTAGQVLDISLYDPAVDIDNYISGELINIEFDLRNDKLYLLDAYIDMNGPVAGKSKKNRILKKQGGDPPPASLPYTELYEVNIETGNSVLQTHASAHNVLWDDEAGINEEHFIGGFQIPVCGVLLVNPSLLPNSARGGTDYEIDWIGMNLIHSKIEYSTDNGLTWLLIADNLTSEGDFFLGFSQNMYIWNVPHNLPSEIIIKVSNADDPLFWDSNVLEVQDLWVKSPNGGEAWLKNTVQNIQWRFNNASFLIAAGKSNTLNKAASSNKNTVSRSNNETVSLYYSQSGSNTWKLITANYPTVNGLNTYSWDITGISLGAYKIKVEYDGQQVIAGKADSGGVEARSAPDAWCDESDNYFSIYQPTGGSRYQITNPNGREVLNGGIPYNVQWRKYGIIYGAILLEYSKDGGLTWLTINYTPIIAGSVGYLWVVPRINSTKCLVRISNYNTHIEFDRSDNMFSIITNDPAFEATNYPNPFNPATRIIFGLEKSSFVSLKIYNSIGQQVAELVNRQLEAGSHEFEFNAAKLPSGVYYYNITRNGKTEIHKMMLLK